MTFEYVEIGFENGDANALVCDTEALPDVLRSIMDETLHEVDVRVRLPLSEPSSRHFAFLSSVDPVLDPVRTAETGKKIYVLPKIRFPLQSVRFFVMCLIEDAERLSASLLLHEPTSRNTEDVPLCPPVDIDGAVSWLMQSERFRLRPKTAHGPELVGDPGDMHEMLVTVLQDNIDFHRKQWNQGAN